ncbi:hypothetical protein SUGI_0122180 [Cryptomeria japonica]|uniref:polygalacturonase-like n=1 Tax=Cryptomeria japonica TaxID=3369 RepID=UPI002408B005|nr:polygalacturonase-like [Cryptomeria japonica]GLJ10102.1 hypothetical protein SUGI_0122180 [Cryptomeria japonica]
MALICVNLRNLALFILNLSVTLAVAYSTESRQYIRSSYRFSHHHDVDGLGTVINVLDYGAVGDGEHDDTKAFGQAWDAACDTPSATLLVPGTKTFLVNNLVFKGKCEPGLIFQVDGNITALEDPKDWESKSVWLRFDYLDQFTLTGNGAIDGNGNKWWDNKSQEKIGKKSSGHRPTAIHLNGCSGVVIKGLLVTNSPKFHFTLSGCENVKFVGVEIRAPEDSPNTDGIDIFRSTNIQIQDCIIGTGDDCVALGNGASDIVIRNLTCGPGHGISIGSLGKEQSKAEVQSVLVDGAKLRATKNGLRIKTFPGGSGMARDIVFENVEMVNAKNPIIIDQYYSCSSDSCRKQDSAVQISNVTFRSISGTSATEAAISLDCTHNKPCTDITFNNVSLALTSGGKVISDCQNAKGQNIGTVIPSGCLAS